MRSGAIRFGVLVPAVTAVLGLCAGTADATPGGPTCNVPADYATISAAVAVPTCTTVNVAPNTYNEQVVITHTLTLNGAQAGVDARGRSGPESIITNTEGPIQIEADNVTIDGFTIEGASSDPTSDPNALGAGIWTNPGFSGTHGGFTIVNNIIQNNIAGIELDSDGTNPTMVQHNLFRNNNLPGAAGGNGIVVDFGLVNATIDSNKFTGDTNESFLNVAPSSGVNITNNTLAGGSSEGFALFTTTSAIITGNTSVGSTNSATVGLLGGDASVTVSGNVLAGGVEGIQVSNPFGVAPNASITATGNCIAGNTTAGLEEDSGGYIPPTPGSLIATNNWWGSATGPTIASNPGGTGDTIIDQDGVVSYKPFATSSSLAGCPPPPPPPCPKGTKANFRWHYSANGSAGGWSGTKTAVCPSALTMGPQAMEGDLKVAPGATLKVGYDFTIPGNNKTIPLNVSSPKVVFTLRCVSGAPASPSTFTVTMPNASFTVTNSNWYPSGDQDSALVYQGSGTVPDACSGGKVRLDKGGTFSASVG
jgi:Right handed beta helix region